jgi:PRC-barrel domain
MATARQPHNLISSDDVHGTAVYGADGERIGEIDELVIEKISGRVAYAVMDFGGFLGIGESQHPLPWSALNYDTSLGGYRTSVTRDQLENAPEYSDDSWQNRDWETRTHRHYNAPPYWNS